jgi:hypothetical protein
VLAAVADCGEKINDVVVVEPVVDVSTLPIGGDQAEVAQHP